MGQNNTEFAEKYITELEEVPCNACGSLDHQVIAERERFGLPLHTVICKGCGLIFINPRPSQRMYVEFYKSDYRKTVSGSDEGDELQFQKEVEIAKRVILPVYKKLLPGWAPSSIMELGSSYGGILHAHQQAFPGSTGFGVEPLLKIGDFSRRRTGATIHTGMVEDYQPDRKYDLVILSRTLNHTLDPHANLDKVHQMLADDGIFALTLQDPLSHLVHLPLETVSEMTHPYLFTRQSIQYLLSLSGLELVGYQDEHIDARFMTRKDFRKLQFSYMVFLARPAKSGLPLPTKPDYMDILERIRANQQAYLHDGEFIESWSKPNTLLRIYRKLLHLAGLW
jgi:hypothetical protein